MKADQTEVLVTQSQRIAELAARPDGVTNKDVQQLFDCDAERAGGLMAITERRKRLVKARGTDKRRSTHWFTTMQAMEAWLTRQLASIDATQGAALRLQATDQAETAQRVANRREARKAARLAKGTAARPKAQPQAELAASPVITSETVVTVHRRHVESHRINKMADPLPCVPGWGGPPPRRDGADDFRAHQRGAA